MDEQNLKKWEESPLPEKKKGFAKGVAAGIIGTVVVLSLVVVLGCKLTGTSIVFHVGNGSGTAMEGKSALLDSDTTKKINELMTYIDLYYYEDEDVEEDELRDSLYAGLVDGIGDKYSVYYNEQDYKDLQISTTGEYYGIGAALSQDVDTMVVTISKVYEGTPSEKAGLLAEDIIVSVDEVDATSMEVSDLVQLIRGEEGTTVHLEIMRPSTGEELSFDVERANVQLPSVTYEMLNDAVGYIYLEQFESGTAKQFEAAVDALTEQGMQALVLDVRYNPGGMITSVVQILDDILPEGTVVYTEDKYGNREDYTSSGETYLDIPIAVLVNGDSASASEILAGAIKDYEYGTLIGTTTFGKGIVQTIFNLEDGDALKLTTAKYFTPKGNYIHGVGITPDIELEYEYTGDPDGDYDKAYDNQLQKAVEVLEEQLNN